MRTRDLDGLKVALERLSKHQIGTHRESDAVTRVFAGRYTGGATHFGLPLPLVAVADLLFRKLPWEEARETVVAIPEAIGRSGRDLRRAIWSLLAIEAEVLQQSLHRMSGNNHILHVAGQVTNGLRALADARSWGVQMIELIADLPKGADPRPDADSFARADNHGYQALRYMTTAAISADIAVAAAVRRKASRSSQPDRLDPDLRRAEEAVDRAIGAALGHAVEAAAATAVASDTEDLPAAAERLRLAGHRRQAASLLHVIRTGGR